jgi:RimJ/RimL family protein N-acetyltransferase
MAEDRSDRMPVVQEMAAIWPLYGLRIRTSRLELRLPTDVELPAVAAAARLIQPERAPRYQRSWMYEPSPTMERRLLQQHWHDLADWRPGSWHLGLAAFLDGAPIGMQDVWAADFAVSRSVATGSWLRLDRQSRGYGTEMREGVLELAFGHLGAREAHTDYLAGNAASEAVSRKLGYRPNGQRLVDHGGQPWVRYDMRIAASDFGAAPERGRISITGIQPCLALFRSAEVVPPAGVEPRTSSLIMIIRSCRR